MPLPPVPALDPEITAGEAIPSEDLDFLQVGVTTRTDVEANLGPPDLDLWFKDAGNMIAYTWEELD